ncbi:hypothetical protein F443_03464 [Phytophthora nicotianae P1569]|uniref:Uncharacterized protein n=1 Tax=Phytophthora nicotianae P1569 TaxID=1317065 RepID=V9FQ92_PHYNI|nr:hypothetical protein F443_03464 [Phytophthora nicotianae P1569]
MDIKESVCNPSEQDTEIETISTDALLDESSDVLFIQTSSGESHEPENGIEENTKQLAHEENTQQKMNAVRRVICMLVNNPDSEDKLMKVLRFLQSTIHDLNIYSCYHCFELYFDGVAVAAPPGQVL